MWIQVQLYTTNKQTILCTLKPVKTSEVVQSYRPISLLPITLKVLENLLYKRLQPKIARDELRQGHSTIEQVHRLVYKIQNNMEMKKYSSMAFLDITQAFDKVWHIGLLYIN